MNSYTENELARLVFQSAVNVHRSLGPGLLEAVYKECLAYELNTCGLYVEKEKSLPVVYKEVKLECGCRMDMVVEANLLLKLKQ